MKIFVTALSLFAILAVSNGFKLGRIIGGRFAKLGQIPYQVAIVTERGMLCGGSILSTTIVITAAHCTYGLSPTGLTVYAGTVNLLQQILTLPVESSSHVVHENYNANGHDYDISIVFLGQALTYSNDIQPVALPRASDPLPDNTVATVSGFGVTDLALNLSPGLLYANVPIQSKAVCSRYFQMTDRMICAGTTSGQVSACQGDSGGPLTVNGKLMGIVSYGPGCGLAAPAVYVNVRNLRSWITLKTGL